MNGRIDAYANKRVQATGTQHPFNPRAMPTINADRASRDMGRIAMEKLSGKLYSACNEANYFCTPKIILRF